MDALADAAVDRLAAEDTALHVDHLQCGLAFVGDDPAAIAEEGEGFIVALALEGGVADEHQLEAALVLDWKVK